jgi:hypothetical protein
VKKLLLFIFLTTCAAPQSSNNLKNNNYNFKKTTSFTDFMNELRNYSIKTPYPDIDKNL